MSRFTQKEVRMPGFRWRMVLTILLILVCVSLRFAYETVQGPLEAQAAVQQLQDSKEAYTISRAWAASNIPGAVSAVTALLVGVLWGHFFMKMVRYQVASKEE